MKKPKAYKPRASPARIQEWCNEQIAKAAEVAFHAALGVDVGESLASLVIENNLCRAHVQKLVTYFEAHGDEEGKQLAAGAAAFLSLPPAQLKLRPAVTATESGAAVEVESGVRASGVGEAGEVPGPVAAGC